MFPLDRPRRLRRTRRTVAVLLLATVVLAACGGEREALVVYSGRTQNLVGPLLEQFSDTNDVPIDVRYGDTAELALLLAEEGDATTADVFLAQSPGAVAFLADQGVLTELDPTVLSEVPPAFRSDSGRWVGVTGRQRVLVVNTDLVDEDELPASVFDLTDSRYRGMVGVAPQNGSFQDFVSAMLLQEGEQATRDWLDGLAANDARTYANNNAIVDAVARGEVPLGLVNHYYNLRFLDEDPDLPTRNRHFAGDDLGNLLITASASIVAGTDRPQAAQQFVEFLISAEAQEYFRNQTFEYPLTAGVEPAEALRPLDADRLPGVDFDQLGDVLRRTTELIAQSELS